MTGPKGEMDTDAILDILIALKERLTDDKERFALGFAIGVLYALEHQNEK